MEISTYKVLLAAGFCAAFSPVFAQEVFPCPESGFPIDAIAEPWEESTKTFANGAVRLVMLAYEDPAAAPFHLALLYSPRENVPDWGRACAQISGPFGGFYALSFQDLQSSYSPAIGLTFVIPAEIYDVSTDGPHGVTLEITFNQSTEVVKARYR